MLNSGYHVNAKDVYCFIPLMLACKQGSQMEEVIYYTTNAL